MMEHRTFFRSAVLFALALLITVPAIGIVSAQDTDAVPFLGITFQETDSGILVTDVIPESGAAEAGFTDGDIITNLNGSDVTVDALRDAVVNANVGDTLDFTVERDGESIELAATLGERPELPNRQQIQIRRRAVLGVNVEETDAGLRVVAVADESGAAQAGVQVDDVITGINDTPVMQTSDVTDILDDLEPGDVVTVDIVRGDEMMMLDVTLGRGNLRGNFDFRLPDNFDELAVGAGVAIAYDNESQTWEIIRLSDDSVLAEAGLQTGDVITAFNGEALDPAGLRALLDDASDDTTITVTVERDGETLDIDAPATAFNLFGRFGGFGFGDGRIPFDGRGFNFFRPGQAQLGVAFVTLNDEVASERGVDVTEGALITEVLEDTPAAEAGLQVGDVIISVDGDVVDEERTLRDRLFAYEADDVVTLGVLRDGEQLNIDVTLAAVDFANVTPFDFLGPDGELLLPDGLDLPDGFEFRFFGPGRDPDGFGNRGEPEVHADV
ncbi:MAG: PDZ domain-containing protein [Chloroflexi bacterium]|nr:MAG: PDZ domain-containing protein [Chloroflexota bacterium]